jgi:membrane protein DedA with SNARE-associated domain
METILLKLSSLKSLEDLLLILASLHSWQICLIATWLLLQGVVLTIFPEEVITVTLGILWSQGKISFPEALFAIQAGLLPANALFVSFGQKFGAPLIRRRPLVWIIDEVDVNQALDVIRNHSKKVIFASRFIPMVRAPLYFATGMSRIGVFNFAKIDFLASLIQLPALLLLGRWIGKSAESLIAAYQKVGLIFVVLVIWTIVFGMVRKLQRNRQSTTPVPK